MPTAGTWFVMCDRKRAISIEKLEALLATLEHADVKRGSDELQITVHDPLTEHDADIAVGLSTARHVPIEAAEIAQRRKRPDVATLDARYELVWDLRMSDEVYNTLCVIAERLEKACGGVVYDVTNGRFV